MDKQILVDFENMLKQYKVLKFDKVWAKEGTVYKLIYNLEGVVAGDRFYANVKLIFWLDEKKEKLTESVVTYLYSLYCDYKSMEITTIEETFSNILALLDQEKTNSELSAFVIDGTDEFNKILKDKGVNDFMQNLSMVPVGNMPCVRMKFKFELKSNTDSYEFQLKSFVDKWELTFGENTEEVALKDVPKKLINMIYDTDRDNV